MYYYIDGNFDLAENANIPFDDAGFLYGDGLFETMRFDRKIIFSPQKHLKRLSQGLNVIDLKIKLNSLELLELLNTVIHKNNLNSGIIRLMITRGSTNKESLNFNVPSIYISIKPFYTIPSGPIKVIYLNEENYPIIRFSPAIKSATIG